MAYIIKYAEGGYFAGERRGRKFWSSKKKDAKVLHYWPETVQNKINRDATSGGPTATAIYVPCECQHCRLVATLCT